MCSMSAGNYHRPEPSSPSSFWKDLLHPAGGQLIVPPSTFLPRVSSLLHRQLAATWEVCGAFEWWALGYLCLSSLLITFFAENLQDPVHLLGLDAFVALVILLLCSVQAHYAARRAIYGPSFASGW